MICLKTLLRMLNVISRKSRQTCSRAFKRQIIDLKAYVILPALVNRSCCCTGCNPGCVLENDTLRFLWTSGVTPDRLLWSEVSDVEDSAGDVLRRRIVSASVLVFVVRLLALTSILEKFVLSTRHTPCSKFLYKNVQLNLLNY